MKVFFIILSVKYLCDALCLETEACIERVRKVAADPRRFWFGESWREICSRRERNLVNCYNPHALQPYNSLGSRLFRVKSYQSGFLQNLRIFPRVVFRIRSGSYRACDHKFSTDEKMHEKIIEADPDMEPVEPFNIRFLPIIRWANMDENDSFLVLMTDVGFGTLNYLAVDFPRKTRVLKHYFPSENFRSYANPIAVLVFRQNFAGHLTDFYLPSDSDHFDLPKFMLSNGLENDLIGLNLILVGTDAYAIERQRLRGIVDNCHSLLEKKVRMEKRWKFFQLFPLNELNIWLSVDYIQPQTSSIVCCEKFELRERKIVLDPLGDGKLPSLAVLNEPRISAMKISQSDVNYQRNARDFVGVVLIEHPYSLLLLDPETRFLYWMIANIPANSLAASNIHDGDEVALYIPPIPKAPKSCSIYMFFLFAQPQFSYSTLISTTYDSKHPLRSEFCLYNCSHRSNFDLEAFKSLHQLRLAALNWMTVCYDVYEAGRQISKISENMSYSEQQQQQENLRNEGLLSKDPFKWTSNERNIKNDELRTVVMNKSEKICSAMGMSVERICAISSSSISFNLFFICSILIFYSTFFPFFSF